MMQEETATATATDSASVFLPQPQPQLRYVDHTYKDFSTYFKEGGRLQKHKKCERNFPARLHAMLSDEQCSHIISWMPHGRSWKVRDKKLLIEEAIPKHFGQSNYTSFARQLSGWGFKRLRKLGPDNGSYYHECFLQGQPRLTVLMRRIYPGRGKATPNIEGEPDFYLISKQFPLHTAETYTEPPPAAVYSYSEPKLDGKKEESGDTVIDSSPQEVMNFEPLPLSSHSIFDSVAMAATSRCETSVNQFHARGVNQYLGKAPQQDGTGRNTQPESHYNYMAKPPTLTPTTPESGNLQDESATLDFFKSLFDDDDDSWTKMISSPSRTIRNDDKR